MKDAESDARFKFKYILSTEAQTSLFRPKANAFALQYGFKNFCASQEWLQKLKRKYNTDKVKLCEKKKK